MLQLQTRAVNNVNLLSGGGVEVKFQMNRINTVIQLYNYIHIHTQRGHWFLDQQIYCLSCAIRYLNTVPKVQDS